LEGIEKEKEFNPPSASTRGTQAKRKEYLFDQMVNYYFLQQVPLETSTGINCPYVRKTNTS